MKNVDIEGEIGRTDTSRLYTVPYSGFIANEPCRRAKTRAWRGCKIIEPMHVYVWSEIFQFIFFSNSKMRAPDLSTCTAQFCRPRAFVFAITINSFTVKISMILSVGLGNFVLTRFKVGQLEQLASHLFFFGANSRHKYWTVPKAFINKLNGLVNIRCVWQKKMLVTFLNP